MSPVPTLYVYPLRPDATIPSRGSSGAAGYDLAAVDALTILPGGRAGVSTGISVRVPDGTYGRIAPRSGLALKHGIDVLAGVVDGDYRGEIVVILLNTGREPFDVVPGARIAQLVLETVATPPVVVVDTIDLTETGRGDGGFGSTGV